MRKGLLWLWLLSATEVRADLIFAPNGAINYQMAPPFFTDTFATPTLRYQQIYSRSPFLSQGASQYLVTELAFSFSAVGIVGGGVGGNGTITLSNIQIALSSSEKAVGGLSATFAENVGADDTVVYA